MSIVNGSFENDFSSWNINLTGGQGGSATIVSSIASLQNPPSGGNVPPFYWYPQEGAKFLALGSGASGPDDWQSVTQTFSASDGDVIHGWAAFDWNAAWHPTISSIDGARVRIYQGTGTLGTIIDTPFDMNGDSIDPLTSTYVEDYYNGPWTQWQTIQLPAGTYTIELGVVNTGDTRFPSFGYFDDITTVPGTPPLPNNKIALKKFSLSPNVQNKAKLDDLIETVNSGTSITFRTIENPILMTGEDCLVPFEIIPATFVVGISDTVGTISSGDQTTYIGGTGKKIYVGSLFESLYEPSILYRKDKGSAEYSTPLDSIRINKITAIVENSHQMGMRKSGTGITTSIEYNTSEDSLGKEWDFYFKDDLRNAKMEFITSSHLDLQITQFIWQGQYHQIANRLGGR